MFASTGNLDGEGIIRIGLHAHKTVSTMTSQAETDKQLKLALDLRRDLSRRHFLKLLGVSAAAGLTGACHEETKNLITLLPGQTVGRFPEKTELILLTDRPPQLETPLYFFRQNLTPNEAFFVRWHYSGIPTVIDTRTFQLKVTGHVQQPLNLSLDDLRKRFEPVTIAAVNQCSGNSRSYFKPRVPGGQWSNGAMGNAQWTGARLKDILRSAGIKAGAVDVSFSGLDEAPLFDMARFEKALTADHALSEEVLVAYEMNGRPLPMLNGFPLRLVVPGWYATYWVKSLAHVNVLPEKFKGYWMDKAYRIPKNADASETPENLAKDTVPISQLNVRSIIVRPDLASDVVQAGKPIEIEGIAFDNGHGITRVEISTDGGTSWQQARLDENSLGKYAFQRWRLAWTPDRPGNHRLAVRAFNAANQQQLSAPIWNKSGYMRNVIEQIEVPVV